MVRAKFTVMSIKDNRLIMECLYSPEVPEDQAFCTATPWGKIEMSIDNPKALEQFEVGKAYYADFTKAE